MHISKEQSGNALRNGPMNFLEKKKTKGGRQNRDTLQSLKSSSGNLKNHKIKTGRAQKKKPKINT